MCAAATDSHTYSQTPSFVAVLITFSSYVQVLARYQLSVVPCAMNEVANKDKDEEVWLHKTSYL